MPKFLSRFEGWKNMETAEAKKPEEEQILAAKKRTYIPQPDIPIYTLAEALNKGGRLWLHDFGVKNAFF